MQTTIISQTSAQIIFEVNDSELVNTVRLLIQDKEINGVLDKDNGWLTIQVEDILSQIKLPMTMSSIKVVLISTEIIIYNPILLTLIPTL